MATKKERIAQAAGNALDRLFTGTEPEAAAETAPQEKTAQRPAKAAKKVFSFRALEDEAESWRAYADARCMTVDAMASAAMQEYVKRHPLTDEERIIYAYRMTVKAKAKGRGV